MPLPISLAHKLTKQLAYLRKSKEIEYLALMERQVQVTVEYDNGVPVRVDAVVVSQHSEGRFKHLERILRKGNPRGYSCQFDGREH